jgi:hypothetical protein
LEFGRGSLLLGSNASTGAIIFGGFGLLDFLCFRQKRTANEKPTKDSNFLAVSAAPSAGVIRFRFKGSSGRE